MNTADFSGAKLALCVRRTVLVVLRDDRSDIPYPGLWDLPGGGREGVETPLECVLRETFEETALCLTAADLSWRKTYPSSRADGLAHWFFGARPSWPVQPAVHLGNEGQAIRWMQFDEFLGLKNAVPHLQTRVKEYVDTLEFGA